jgi:hypothetical protein
LTFLIFFGKETINIYRNTIYKGEFVYMPRHNNELNLDNLDQIFQETDNLDRDMEQKRVDFQTDIDYSDAVKTLESNIFNANQLLEKIQHEMNNGNFSARLAEVASTIINSITQASKEILSDENYGEYMEVRRALVQLKAKELDIKEMRGVRPTNQTNVLVTSREELLKMLQDKKPKEITNQT